MRVTNIRRCQKACEADPKCTAFHYYLLDPGAPTNCWLWTTDGYSGNGSEKAYCFVKDKSQKDKKPVNSEKREETTEEKKDDHPEDHAETEVTERDEKEKTQVEVKRTKPKPRMSMKDWDDKYEEWKRQ